MTAAGHVDVASRLVAVARRYARLGWPVVPLHCPVAGGCSCREEGCGSPGKHPRTRHGLRDASLDPGQIDRWWRRWPAANVAVATGARSGLLVIDIDGPTGETTIAALEASNAPLPATRTQWTGGGRHLLFAHPGRRVPNSAGKLGLGVDVRGDGGFIVAPPSRHPSGRTYTWQRPSQPLAAVPDWLLALLADQPQSGPAPSAPARIGSRYARAALAREAERVRAARPPIGEVKGTRNATLNAAAFSLGTLVGGGVLSEADVWEALLPAANVCGLPDREARRTIASGLRAGTARPRQIRP